MVATVETAAWWRRPVQVRARPHPRRGYAAKRQNAEKNEATIAKKSALQGRCESN